MFEDKLKWEGELYQLCHFSQISWRDLSRICRWAAGGSRGIIPHQGEPKTARDTHLGLKVPALSACSTGSLKRSSRCSPSLLLLHFHSADSTSAHLSSSLYSTTSLSVCLNPGLDTRPSTTDCSTMGSTLSGRRGSSRSMTSWRMPSSLSISRPRQQSTLPKWPRTLFTSISATPRCSRTRRCTGWAADAQNRAGSPSRGMKGWG